MTDSDAGDDATDRDARLTADRREDKFVLAAAQAATLTTALDARLARHRFRGDGANVLPGAHHFVTTIYFDTPSRALFRAAADDTHLKLRAKEYYDLHPQLIETASDVRELIHDRRVLWLELKHRDGAQTGKQRVALPKRDVPSFFREGRITPEMLAVQEAARGARASATLEGVRDLCARYREPFAADCLVNYRRLAWQDEVDTLRVTLDVGLAFYAPPPDLFAHDRLLVREELGPRVGHEPRAVVEVKSRDAVPGWLAAVLDGADAEAQRFSKFEASSRARHG